MSDSLNIRPIDEDAVETLDDIEAELQADNDAAAKAERAAKIEAEVVQPVEPRAQGAMDGLLCKGPALALNAIWAKFKLGELTPEQIAALDAASLQAILTYSLPDLPPELRKAIDGLLSILGPWSDVIQICVVLTSMQIFAKKSARDVTPTGAELDHG